MNDHDRPDLLTLESYRRALSTLPATTRATLLRMARVILEAGRGVAPSTHARLVFAEGVAGLVPDETPDDLSRAEARRILSRRGRWDGVA
jgi:hypothetical protein